MIVTMFAMLAMNVPGDDVVDVTRMRHDFMTAADAVKVRGFVRGATVTGGTCVGIGHRNGKFVLIDVVAVDVVQVAVVDVVDVIVVPHAHVPAVSPMFVTVLIVYAVFHYKFSV